MIAETFINEKGNVICVSIADYYPDLVQMKITGPHSECENIITPNEARKLRKLLEEAGY